MGPYGRGRAFHLCVDDRIRAGYDRWVSEERFDVEALDAELPFEIDHQRAHLFKHPYLGLDHIAEAWAGEPLSYPARPPAHWLMVAEVAGAVLVVPLAPSDTGDRRRCRPIGCYIAAEHLAQRYREDR